MFNFFKKKKPESAEPEKKAAPADETLSAITYHTMPKKFINAAGRGGGMHPTKKWGMVIVGGGGLALVAGAVLLVWYIFFASPSLQPATVSSTTAPAHSSSASSEAETAAPTDQSAESAASTTPAETEAADTGEKACGAATLSNAETSEVFACAGERIAANCSRAAATVDTTNVSGISFTVLGLRQDSCLVQVTYPDSTLIADATLQDYANTYVRCPYNTAGLTSLGYSPAQLARYVYDQTSLDGMTEGRNCEGSAYTLWLERDQRAAAAEANVASSSPASLADNFVPGADTDGDGLTDIEETTIFATSAANPDADGDSYPDGTEVLNGYNPAGAGTLLASGLVVRYANTAYGYNILYPKDWRLEDGAGGENVIFFSNQSGFIQVIAQLNQNKQSIASWYEAVNGAAPASSAETLKSGFEVVYSPDRLTAYVTRAGGGDYVYVITYSPGEDKKLEYRTTFQMMVQTLAPAP